MKQIAVALLLIFSIQSIASADEVDSLCAKFKDLEAPLKDLPSAKDTARLKGCDSEKLYYGIGMKVNDRDARLCAFNEDSGEGVNFSGPGILMMIYANGRGVPKNIPLAKHFACEVRGAQAELEFRLKHLDELAKKSDKFDICDDATSGALGGECEIHRQSILDVARQTNIDKIKAKFTEPQKLVFQKLEQASKHFTEKRSDEEIDQSGTLRSAFVQAEAGIQKADFIQSLDLLETKKAMHYTDADFKAEDAKLNELYKQIEAIGKKCENEPDGCMYWGTIKFAGIRQTQLAWIGYRDAWAEFAKLRYPTYSENSVKAWFTKKRNHMLRSFTKVP